MDREPGDPAVHHAHARRGATNFAGPDAGARRGRGKEPAWIGRASRGRGRTRELREIVKLGGTGGAGPAKGPLTHTFSAPSFRPATGALFPKADSLGVSTHPAPTPLSRPSSPQDPAPPRLETVM